MDGIPLSRGGGSITEQWKDAVAKSKSRIPKDNRSKEMSPQVPVAARRTVFEVILDMGEMEDLSGHDNRNGKSHNSGKVDKARNKDVYEGEEVKPKPVEASSKRTSDVTDVDDETDTLPGDGISEVDNSALGYGKGDDNEEAKGLVSTHMGDFDDKEDDDSIGDSDYDSREGGELVLDGSVGSFVSDLPSSDEDDESYEPKRTSYRIRYDGPTNLPIDKYKPPPLPNHDERFEPDFVARDGPSLPSRTYDKQPRAPGRSASGSSDFDDDESTINSHDSCNRPDVFITPMAGITEAEGMWTVKRVWALEEADKDELEHTVNNSQLFQKIRTLVGAPDTPESQPPKDGAPKLPMRSWRVAKVRDADLDLDDEPEEEMVLHEAELQEGIKTFVEEAAKEEVKIAEEVVVHEAKREEKRRLKLERTKSKRWGNKKTTRKHIKQGEKVNGIPQTGYFVKQPLLAEKSVEEANLQAESQVLTPLPMPKTEPLPEVNGESEPYIEPEPNPVLLTEPEPEVTTALEPESKPAPKPMLEPVPKLSYHEPKRPVDEEIVGNEERPVETAKKGKSKLPSPARKPTKRGVNKEDVALDRAVQSSSSKTKSKLQNPVRRAEEQKNTKPGKKIVAKPVIERTKKQLMDPAKGLEQSWWKGTVESSSSEESSLDGSDGSSSASASVETEDEMPVKKVSETKTTAGQVAEKTANGPDYWWHNHKPGKA
jgi:hypothetical protein